MNNSDKLELYSRLRLILSVRRHFPLFDDRIMNFVILPQNYQIPIDINMELLNTMQLKCQANIKPDLDGFDILIISKDNKIKKINDNELLSYKDITDNNINAVKEFLENISNNPLADLDS
ncbi:hypothetical protein EGI15_19460 [Chryseobacterium cucumeris]|uniref:Uncharacterized protein n=1 Tax=Chryseobacterium cucumeris TaxID=1813611 RepID=A0ABX9X3N6_9FLAO|nr:hypothetical protein [Chryseobacterium cucumeris]ROH88860.1 hypothetical protein EGI15_19460 [Chryseobacterium cucumeris]